MNVIGHTTTRSDLADPASAAGCAPAASSIRDVARVAGVSYQTVSRVINDHPSVRPATRERVEKAIRQLDFRPSAAARALRRGLTDQVTVLTSETSLFGYAATLAGIEQAARRAKVRVAISVLESAERQHVEAAIEQVRDPRSGAAIVLAYDPAGLAALEALPDDVHRAVAAESVLGRLTDKADERPNWTWFDEVAAAYKATRHLLELGHRTVHHIPIPSSTAVGERQRGWHQALQEAGAPVPPVPTMTGWEVEKVYAHAMDLLVDPTVTAVLCGNDEYAAATLRAAHDRGLTVPSDVSVIGFDDIPLAPYLIPALTTVRLDFAALGARAFDLLRLHPNDTPPGAIVPDPGLVMRGSSGPPPDRRFR